MYRTESEHEVEGDVKSSRSHVKVECLATLRRAMLDAAGVWLSVVE